METKIRSIPEWAVDVFSAGIGMCLPSSCIEDFPAVKKVFINLFFMFLRFFQYFLFLLNFVFEHYLKLV